MTMYAVYSNGNWEAEFETYQEARDYIRNLVKDLAAYHGKSEKYIKSILLLTIEEVQY